MLGQQERQMENQSDQNQPEEKAIGVLTDKVPIVVCSKCGCEIDVEDLDPFVQVECPDCSTVETVPAKLGPFLLLNLIGTGGMGGVYYAKDESLGRFVAIKVMLKSIGENKEFVESFKREAQSVARLNHPNIVQIYSFGQEKGQPFIVMELVPGQRFDKMVETKNALDQAFVMRVGLDIAEGLKAADEAAILHGDIKPENILLDEKMRAKLVDFGIATFANQGQPDGIWGTPYYIAPEKVRRQKVDCRADIYGLGATLFHALSGHPPFEGKTPIDVVKARLNHPARALHLVRHDVDPFVEKIIARMLEAEPNRRYPNYNSLISDMRKAVQQLGSPGAVSGFASDMNRASGKIFASKKHTTGSIPGTPQDMPLPQPTRLVVHKKVTTIGPHVTESHKPPPRTGPSKAEVEQRVKRAKRIFWTFVLLLAVGGGVAVAIHLSGKKKAEQAKKQENYAVSVQKNTATNTYGKIFLAAGNVITMANTAVPMIDQATNAVFFILGEPLEAVEAVAPPAPPVVTPPPAKAVPPPAESAPVASVIPADVESRPVRRPPVAAEPVEAPKPVVEAPKHIAPVEEKEPKVSTRKLIATVAKLTANATAVQELQAASLVTCNEILAATTIAVTAPKVKALEEALARAQALELETKSTLEDAKKTLKAVLDMQVARQRAIEEEKKTEDERIKAAAAAEAESKKAEALKKLVENELTLIEATRNNSLVLLKQHKYKDILDALAPQVATYQTDEGKAAVKVLVDRYTRLQKMKTFIIERLNAEPFKWGIDIPKVGSLDVLGADENNVKIKDRAIPWAEITTAQMKKFLDNYLKGPSSQKLTVRVLGEQNLAAAIFCYENGGVKAASGYAEKAGELCSDLQAESKRLLPLE